jgi:hypothetical protein
MVDQMPQARTAPALSGSPRRSSPEAPDHHRLSARQSKSEHSVERLKDVAAMANSGGGTLVFGVTEAQKAATGRRDTGELTEGYECGLRSAAVDSDQPAGLRARGTPARRTIRIDADTVWIRERQIEAIYRARFDERRRCPALTVGGSRLTGWLSKVFGHGRFGSESLMSA